MALSREATYSKSVGYSTLIVHDVGDYIASCVPDINSFGRLDQKFRLDHSILHRGGYNNFAFAVFQLKPSMSVLTVHPMAYEFAPSSNRQLFFPTLHIHDGEIHKRENFDHKLYFQGDMFSMPLMRRSRQKVGVHLKMSKVPSSFVDDEDYVWRYNIQGEQFNKDVVLSR